MKQPAKKCPAKTFMPLLSSEDESIRALLLHIARALVPREGTVTVDIITEGGFSTASVMISEEHLGRLLGEQGRIVKSIRTILTAAAMTFQKRYTLDIKAIS